ncbi:cystathionine beta-lyase [Tamaricihabitans halophyticus]|uniref:cysteine-S-conjugate beta-lyase n=1 Tax=Tamaricihabitans halophyticus TaxID=1262583 RepID=A0A4R2R0M0_9PSEU|nr:aminotransferase class I/II-fold pyridoxal phosphate-dependent enzyme [Tamaricihabitans halophyticus]TCP52991.1 cystathionine beta-lyase [Tamaricihabitans halophyticus]
MASNPLEELSLDQLRKRTSKKWRTHPADVLPLWVAEMDVPLAEPIVDALKNAIDQGDTGYPAGDGYANALARFARNRWGWHGFQPDRAIIVPDVMLGIVEVLRVITEPGDPVVVNAPVYPPFFAFTSHADRRVVESPLTATGRIDLDRLADTFQNLASKHARVTYLLSNPHNPTGAVHTRAELSTVAELASRYGVRVIADEIHAPLVLPGSTFVPYLSVAGADDAFSLMSASKAWNLAGLKAALAIAGPAATDDLARIPEEVSHGPSHLGIIAHTAAFAAAGDWLDALLAGLDVNRSTLGNFLTERIPEFDHTRPEGTYLAWIDCRRLGLPEEHGRQTGNGAVTDLEGPAKLLLERARVAVNAGHVFGSGGSGHIRLNFATSPTILTEALTRIEQAVRQPAAP